MPPRTGRPRAPSLRRGWDRSQGPVATVINRQRKPFTSATIAVAGGGPVAASGPCSMSMAARLRSADPAQPVEVLGVERAYPIRVIAWRSSRMIARSGAVTAARKETRQQRAPEAPRRSIEDLLAQLKPRSGAGATGGAQGRRSRLARRQSRPPWAKLENGCGERSTSSTAPLGESPRAMSTSPLPRTGLSWPSIPQTPAPVRRLADQQDVMLRSYNVIYNLLEDVEQTLRALVEPEVREVVLGHAEIRAHLPCQPCPVPSSAATCRDGVIRQGARARVVRRDAEVYNGRGRLAAALQGRRGTLWKRGTSAVSASKNFPRSTETAT